MPMRYNAMTQMLDVFAEDRTLIGALPHTRQGELAAEDVALTHALVGPHHARRIVVAAGGTPNIAPIRRGQESWETTVRRHQAQLRLALASQADAHARAVGR